MNANELIMHEKMRYDCYRFLSACFCQPQKDFFEEESLLKNLTMYLQSICPQAASFSAAMEENIRQHSNEDLLIEYARLFVGPFELKAPPYGSVYIDEGRQVMGDSTLKVIAMYEQEGLSKDNEFNDLPDHIAVELEFISFLIYKEIQALERSDFKAVLEMIGKQERFLQLFLAQWIAQFCEKIRQGTDNGFYIALAGCLSTFIRNSDLENLREAVQKESFSLLPIA